MKLILTLLFCYLFYLAQDKIYEKLWNRGLNVHVSFDDTTVIEGQSTYLTEVIENDNSLLLPIFQVKLQAPKEFVFAKESNTTVTDCYYRNDVYSLMPHQRITRKLPLLCKKRGCFLISQLDIVSRNLFMTSILADHIPTNALLHVLPKKIPMNEISPALISQIGEVIRRNSLFTDPFAFKGIREYRPHDTMHSINWKVSAKYQSLYVNTYDATSSKELYLFLNLEMNSVFRKEELQEESIRIADTIADLFITKNIPLHFYCNGLDKFTKKAFTMEAGCGKDHMKRIDISLARLDLTLPTAPTLPMLDAISKKDPSHTEIILISNYRKDDLVSYYKELARKGYPVTFIIPEYLDHDVFLEQIPNAYKWEVNYREKISEL